MTWTKPGEMTQKIIIKHITGYTQVNGDNIPIYEPLFSPWSKIEINSGGEFWASQKTNAKWNGLFKFWHYIGLDTTMKVFYGTREFDILTVINPQEANRETWLECEEVI
jgi:SPP1 family predicted phage head-tail adaptor